MKQHRYRITVEHLATADGSPPDSGAPLQFEVGAHDEILALVKRSRQRGDFDQDSAAAFTVGLKLLGEVMLQNRENPLFEDFGAHFGEFVKRLKGRAKRGASATDVVPASPENSRIAARLGHVAENVLGAMKGC